MKTWTRDEVHALGVTTDLVTAGSVFRIGRTKSYELARRGEFPVPLLKVGETYVVPVAALLTALCIDHDMDEAGTHIPATVTHLEPTGGARHDHTPPAA